MLIAEGPGLERVFSVLGSYLYDSSKPAWGWRTQVDLPDADHLVVTALNISPQGAEAKGIELDYRRVTG